MKLIHTIIVFDRLYRCQVKARSLVSSVSYVYRIDTLYICGGPCPRFLCWETETIRMCRYCHDLETSLWKPAHNTGKPMFGGSQMYDPVCAFHHDAILQENNDRLCSGKEVPPGDVGDF